MSEIDVSVDRATLSITLTAWFDADRAAVWDLWADPRQLERWWGPPSHPATVLEHDLHVGGVVRYYMTGPDGARGHGRWRVTTAEPPALLRFVDEFVDEDGRPVAELPSSSAEVRLRPLRDGTEMILRSSYPDEDALQRIVDLGAPEGLRLAVGQLSDLLADHPPRS